MNCPQCGTVISDASAVTLKPAKVKNLQIFEWCFDCKKVKAYSCTMLFGEVGDDPEAVDAPDICFCSMVAPRHYPSPFSGGTITLC